MAGQRTEAIATGHPGASTRTALETLTERELEVLRRVADGPSTSEIATKLFLGQSTIKTHIGHIREKCDLGDRVRAVILGHDSGLVRPGTARLG